MFSFRLTVHVPVIPGLLMFPRATVIADMTDEIVSEIFQRAL